MMSRKINRKARTMNAYVANIIRLGTPFAIRKDLYFEYAKPKMKMMKGKLTQIGVSIQRVKARELST